MKKILVIDGNSIINRAFFGIKPLTNKAGKHTNAIHGMLNIISRQIDAIKQSREEKLLNVLSLVLYIVELV